MNKSPIVCFVALSLFGSVIAQSVMTTQMGDFTFSSGTDAYGNWFSGSTVRIGDMSFHNYNGANGCDASGSTVNIGNMSFHNLTFTDGSSMSGTSRYLGDLGFHNFSCSDVGVAHDASLSIGTFGNNDADANKFNVCDETDTGASDDGQEACFRPAKFTFGENSRIRNGNDSNIRRKPSTRIFDINTNTITAAGILISPGERNKDSKPGLTLDEIYARAQEAVKNKHFVMVAKIVGIFTNTRRVLLDSCDTITFDRQEFSKIKGVWKIGDLVSVSELLDDDGNFLEYEFWVYASLPVKGEVVDAP